MNDKKSFREICRENSRSNRKGALLPGYYWAISALHMESVMEPVLVTFDTDSKPVVLRIFNENVYEISDFRDYTPIQTPNNQIRRR